MNYAQSCKGNTGTDVILDSKALEEVRGLNNWAKNQSETKENVD